MALRMTTGMHRILGMLILTVLAWFHRQPSSAIVCGLVAIACASPIDQRNMIRWFRRFLGRDQE
jgi:hypothetical protein